MCLIAEIQVCDCTQKRLTLEFFFSQCVCECVLAREPLQSTRNTVATTRYEYDYTITHDHRPAQLDGAAQIIGPNNCPQDWWRGGWICSVGSSCRPSVLRSRYYTTRCFLWLWLSIFYFVYIELQIECWVSIGSTGVKIVTATEEPAVRMETKTDHIFECISLGDLS